MTAHRRGQVAWGTVIAIAGLLGGAAGAWGLMTAASARSQERIRQLEECSIDHARKIDALATVGVQLEAIDRRQSRIELTLDRIESRIDSISGSGR